MSRRLQHIISVSLVFILMMPLTVRLLDSSLHHHDTFTCTAKSEHHFHEHHEKCPIPSYEVVFFTFDPFIHESQSIFYYETLFLNDTSIAFLGKPRYSFSLRAPPHSIYTSVSLV